MNRSTEPYIQIRINRNVSIAAITSLLVHVLILFLLSYYDLLKPNPPTAEQEQSMDVTLELPATESPKDSVKESVKKPRTKSPRIKIAKLPPIPAPAPPNDIPVVPAVPLPTPAPQQAQSPPKSVPPKPTPPAAEKYTDMASYMAAAKERRRLAGDPSAINEEAATRESSEDAARLASLRRPPSGSNGIFTIIRRNNRTIVFDFHGWKNEFSFARTETYAVDADISTDVEHAMVRKIIEIIRRDYYGDNSDFNWTSQRLGQVVSLSARPQDNAFLENFLMEEFFGSRGIVPR